MTNCQSNRQLWFNLRLGTSYQELMIRTSEDIDWMTNRQSNRQSESKIESVGNWIQFIHSYVFLPTRACLLSCRTDVRVGCALWNCNVNIREYLIGVTFVTSLILETRLTRDSDYPNLWQNLKGQLGALKCCWTWLMVQSQVLLVENHVPESLLVWSCKLFVKLYM